MKVFLFLSMTILILAAPFSASAQRPEAKAGDPIIAGGSPPLRQSTADRIIELFEFALDAEFSSRQREEFVRQLAAQWKSGDSQAIQSYGQLLEIFEKIKSMNEADRREAQVQFQAALLEELSKNAEHPRNRVLLEVFNQAHPERAIRIGPGNSSKSPVQPVPNEASGGRVPAAIVGTWQTGTVSSTSYTNSTTGSTLNAGGTQVMYRIFADGRYEYSALTTQTAYRCTTNLLTYKTGRVVISGSTVTFMPQGGKFTSEDNCNPQYNYEKPAVLDRETYNFRVERDEYGTKICLQNAAVNGCAYRHD